MAFLVCLAACLLAPAQYPSDPGLPVTYSMYSDPYKIVHAAPGVPDGSIYSGFENRENVEMLTGNLLVSHPASRTYALDGGGAISLSRIYNSKLPRWKSVNVYGACDDSGGFSYKFGLDGDSWVGLGWKLHLGRVYTDTMLRCDSANAELELPGIRYYETANGTSLRFEAFNGIEFTSGTPQANHNIEFIHNLPVCLDQNPPCPGECYACDPDLPGRFCPPPDEVCDNCGNCALYSEEEMFVKYPDGSVHEFERIVPDEVLDVDYVNTSRNGWYVTTITDPHGNVVEIEYYGGTLNPEYPEAIREIRVQRSPEISFVPVIRADVYGMDSDGTVITEPAGSEFKLGRLKRLWSRLDSNPETWVAETYDYESRDASIVALVSPVDAATLKSVALPDVGGQGPAGIIQYAYEGALKGQAGVFGPILDTIVYPTGAASVYDYAPYVASATFEKKGASVEIALIKNEYWGWANSQVNLHWCNELNSQFWGIECHLTGNGYTDPNIPEPLYPIVNRDLGVSKRTVFPDGLAGTDSYSWTWSRGCPDNGIQDEYADCVTDYETTAVFRMTNPLGLVTAHTYGKTHTGFPLSIVNEDSNGATVRTTLFDYETAPGPTSVKKRATTIFHDDDGTCFSGTTPDCDLDDDGVIDNCMTQTTTHDQLTPFYQWEVTALHGDYLADPVVAFSDYQTPAEMASDNCVSDLHHIVGTVAAQSVRDGTSRYDRRFDFNCKGLLTERESFKDPVLDIWMPGDLDDLNAWSGYAPAISESTPALNETFGFFSNGNLHWIEQSGGDLYENGAPSNDYRTELTWAYGGANTLTSGSPTQMLSYLSHDATIDIAGQVESSRDSNGVESAFSYDELGRITQITPAGSEHPVRVIYPDLKTMRVIHSPGVETTYESTDSNQIFTEQIYDGLGRPIESIRAMPDGLAHQVTRYDPLGRVIFVSEWMSADDYDDAMGDPITWDVDLDGDNVTDYSVDVPKSASGVAWGTRTFYGTGPPNRHPLQGTPDGLGRVRMVRPADGARVRTNYCGPHKRVTTFHNGFPANTALNTYYYDGVGRLAVVDTPSGGADAEYRYDPMGNLIKVNLIQDADMPADPFEAWKSGPFTAGQVRTFSYNAVGQLESAMNPENGTTTYDGYDASGNLLTYQDALATKRGYHFKNTYDNAGRLLITKKVLGPPASPATDDDDRLDPTTGDFESGMSGWYEGTIISNAFNDSGANKNTEWKDDNYSSCVPAPVNGGNGGLYFGKNCAYTSVAEEPQVVRTLLSDVTRDDTVSFQYWRHVREGGTGDKDIFEVFVTLQTEEPTPANKRVLFRMDDSDPSFQRWRQSQAIRPGDFFTQAEWNEDSTESLYLYLAFTKGDDLTSGLGSGLMVDNIFVGLKAVETLAEFEYDIDTCSPLIAGEACTGATNKPLGKLARVTSYHNDLPVSDKFFVYEGLNGRLSGELQQIDWSGGMDDYVILRNYEDHGLETGRTVSQPAELEMHRGYYRWYDRGLLSDVGAIFAAENFSAASAEITYTASGAISAIQFGNGAKTTIAHDLMHRPASFDVTSADNTPLWSSGIYTYDGVGNITDIGSQDYVYDAHGRVESATVLGQAQGLSTPLDLDYIYDEYGNMTGRDWNQGASNFPTGFVITGYTHDGNRIEPYDPVGTENDIPYEYDLNGNMTRFASSGVSNGEGATWDERNSISAFLRNGDVEERYTYDSDGYRLLKIQKGDTAKGVDGYPRISVRTGAGQLVSQYVRRPQDASPVLEKEFVYGAGQLLAERIVSSTVQTLVASYPLYIEQKQKYEFVVTEGDDGGPYSIDIRSETGAPVLLTGKFLGSGGQIRILESYFTPGEANYIRIKSEAAEDAVYSAPVTLVIDSTVEANSSNQINAITIASLSVPLAYSGSGTLVQGSPGCDPTPVARYSFKDEIHHRDHLGNLRVVTDDAGWQPVEDGARDYYPFGMEITPSNETDVTAGSRKRFTGHERDVESGLDYMKARSFSASFGRFLAVDPFGGSVVGPQTWNRYSYVGNSPLSFVDPDGLCAAPSGLQSGEVGICYEAFISTRFVPTKTLLGAAMLPLGNNRSFEATAGGSSKIHVDFRIRRGEGVVGGNDGINVRVGSSPLLLGLAATSGVLNAATGESIYSDITGDSGASVSVSATNGVAKSGWVVVQAGNQLAKASTDSIDVAFSVYVTRENRVIGQVNADGYPSHEAYAYVKTGSLILALPLFQIKETTIDELDQGLEVRRSFSVPLP